MKNGVVLITYADSLGGDLKALKLNLDKFFPGCFSGIHILPFFPSSGDRGFSPVCYDKIAPEFGDWNDLAAIGEDYEIIADFMVNHISRRSFYFQDWLKKGEASQYSELFIPVDKVFGTEDPENEYISKIYRRQPTPPWITVQFDSGEKRKIWCTFGEEQIDIDIASNSGMSLFRKTLKTLADAGIKTVRLDAVGYIIKKQGTSCFMVEPEVWETLTKLKTAAAELGIQLLPEMHEHYSIQQKMAEHGYQVYDFALPMLVLYAWYARDFAPLKHWFSICPRNQYTTLDTHDGIGVVDAADLLTPEQTSFTVEKLYSSGSNINRKYSSTEYNNLDIYQINCTFFSALGNNDDAYIISRAIQFFAPGTPQVYYVGMLAGSNDLNLVEETRNGRDINRHNYSYEELSTEVYRPVIQRLKRLMEFRMNCRAFDGELTIDDQTNDKLLILKYSNGTETAKLSVDLNNVSTQITRTHKDGEISIFFP